LSPPRFLILFSPQAHLTPFSALPPPPTLPHTFNALRCHPPFLNPPVTFPFRGCPSPPFFLLSFFPSFLPPSSSMYISNSQPPPSCTKDIHSSWAFLSFPFSCALKFPPSPANCRAPARPPRDVFSFKASIPSPHFHGLLLHLFFYQNWLESAVTLPFFQDVPLFFTLVKLSPSGNNGLNPFLLRPARFLFPHVLSWVPLVCFSVFWLYTVKRRPRSFNRRDSLLPRL